MHYVPGSADDFALFEAGRILNDADIGTRLPSQSIIASGGVDLFLAGTRRQIEDGASLGVHSWASPPDIQGSDLPADDPSHVLYVGFYRDIDIDEAFYWVTLEAAPSDGIHWMTAAELQKFRAATE